MRRSRSRRLFFWNSAGGKLLQFPFTLELICINFDLHNFPENKGYDTIVLIVLSHLLMHYYDWYWSNVSIAGIIALVRISTVLCTSMHTARVARFIFSASFAKRASFSRCDSLGQVVLCEMAGGRILIVVTLLRLGAYSLRLNDLCSTFDSRLGRCVAAESCNLIGRIQQLAPHLRSSADSFLLMHSECGSQGHRGEKLVSWKGHIFVRQYWIIVR